MRSIKKKKILILGVGSILHKDDGLGVFIVNEIESSAKGKLKDVEVADGGTLGFELLSVMSGREKIVIIDALKIDDAPGSIYRFPAKHLSESGNKFSMHDVGVKKIIDMLALTGEEPEIEIIGIVPEDFHSFEIGISDSVMRSVPKAVEYALDAALN
jgi:hydrogenase maturation protease